MSCYYCTKMSLVITGREKRFTYTVSELTPSPKSPPPRCCTTKVFCTEIELLSIETFADLGKTGYLYHGILELDDILGRPMKNLIRESYIKRLQILLKSKLIARNFIIVVNTLSLVSYSERVIELTMDELHI